MSQTFNRSTHAAALLALLYAPSAFAQAPEPPPRLEASAQFAFLDTRGNAEAQSLGAGGDVTWRPDPWTYVAKLVFAQTETDAALSARSLAALSRASRALTPRLSYYGQYDFLRDTFAGVTQRHVIEGGASYLAAGGPPHRLRLDAGFGYLHEGRFADEHFDSATLSLAAGYKFTVSPTSELTYDPRFLLTLADAGAWKYDQNVALAVALNTILSLKLSHTLRHSAEPPAGFEKNDTIMAVSLVAKVRRPQ